MNGSVAVMDTNLLWKKNPNTKTTLVRTCLQNAVRYRLPHGLLWRKRSTQWKKQRAPPKKTWMKQVKEDLKTLQCNIVEAIIVNASRQEWKRVVQAVLTPVAPTAALRSRTAPPDAS
ncbi:hypothetical protein Y032_0004g2068 [Ancylostoma ceylanicum]|uniref:Uncharacterized protein n=1 Tax=Ancylostoma ceylanicum TaxID=53326 RepID=A0A016VW55_9BILA|nr:hypothetical protein Y032_0004g2068 [Ancylostoma ceylanicum]